MSNDNYENFTITIEVTVKDKESQTLIFANETVSKTYGDADFTEAVSGAQTAVAYSSSDATVATVDSTGKVHILKAGNCTITAEAAENVTYSKGTASYALTVGKATVTITAADRNAYVGDTAPELGTVLGTDYTVTGLVGDDTLDETGTQVVVAYASDPDMSAAGEVAISVSGGAVPNTDNYEAEINYVSGKLTISARPAEPSTPSSSGGSSGSSHTSRPSTGRSGSSSGSTETGSNGTTTTTKTSSDGTVTETTKYSDGSQTVTETKPNGTVTTTEREADGTTTKTVESPDGSIETTVTQPDGTRAETTVDGNGRSESTVELPKRGEESVSLPIPAVRPGVDSNSAPVVTVTIPAARGAVQVEVPVRNVTAGTVAVAVGPNGTQTVLKASIPTAGGLSFAASGEVTVKIVDNSKTFFDVASSDWHKDAVDFASARGLFNGTSVNTFTPDGIMTRGMLATVLHNLENNPAAPVSSAFADVKSGAWYADAIQWAAGKGLISGYGNGFVGPENPVTREQLAVILWNYAGSPEVSGSLRFNDASAVSGYAQSAMLWATQNGILAGSNGSLAPNAPASRAQVAQVLMNFYI